MLTYTLSEDLNRGAIGPCIGGHVRLSIIRICKGQGWEIPPEALEETTGLEALKDINFELQARRAGLRKAEQAAETARRAIERAEREMRIAPELAAKVADLRARAAVIRRSAQMAERIDDLNRELAEAARLEAEASRLVTG